MRSGLRQQRERGREQMVACGLRGVGAVLRPGGSAAPADVRAVDDVVVDQRRHVDQLDRDPLHHRWLRAAWGREERQRGPQPLPAGRQRVRTHSGDRAGMGGNNCLEAILDRAEVVAQALDRRDRLERANRRAPRPRRRCAAPRSSRP